MLTFLRNRFPELQKMSDAGIMSLAGINIRAHDIHEPLEGHDVFIDNTVIGQIGRLPTEFDPPTSCYYKEFYLYPADEHKKKLVDQIYARLETGGKDKMKIKCEKAKSIFEQIEGVICKTNEPLGDLFGQYNIAALIEHPAFVSGSALIALFDGITGKLKVYDKLVKLYGGLSFEQSAAEYDVDQDNDKILDCLYQDSLIVKQIIR